MTKQDGFDQFINEEGLSGSGISELLLNCLRRAYEAGYEDAIERRMDIIGSNGNVGYE